VPHEETLTNFVIYRSVSTETFDYISALERISADDGKSPQQKNTLCTRARFCSKVPYARTFSTRRVVADCHWLFLICSNVCTFCVSVVFDPTVSFCVTYCYLLLVECYTLLIMLIKLLSRQACTQDDDIHQILENARTR
jgi:hypothetical protein